MRKMLILIMLSIVVSNSTAKALTTEQIDRAERIADVCVEEWDSFGVLPSTCIGQAMIESTLGEHCSGNNLWGIKSGAESYASLEAGVYRYLKVINNGCYPGAPFELDGDTQIRAILDGGYCQPVGAYYSNFRQVVDKYGFEDYDKPIFDKIKRKEQERLQGQKFIVVYDCNLSENEAVVNPEVAKSGAVEIYQKDVLTGIFDVKSDKNLKKNVIRVGRRQPRERAKLKFYDAKG